MDDTLPEKLFISIEMCSTVLRSDTSIVPLVKWLCFKLFGDSPRSIRVDNRHCKSYRPHFAATDIGSLVCSTYLLSSKIIFHLDIVIIEITLPPIAELFHRSSLAEQRQTQKFLSIFDFNIFQLRKILRRSEFTEISKFESGASWPEPLRAR